MVVRSAGLLSVIVAIALSLNGCDEVATGPGASGPSPQPGGPVRSIKHAESVGESFAGITKSGDFFQGTIIASDPTIVRTGGALRMFYTDLDVSKNRTVIATATSPDGVSWGTQGSARGISGLALAGDSGNWDENIESASVVRVGGTWRLYYSGYRDKGRPFKGFPAAMGLATSSDGQQFTRVTPEPILEPTPGWYDNDAIYSASVIYENGTYYMVYVGHAYTNTSKIPVGGVYLLGATSQDGVNWTKQETPIARPGQFSGWRADGLAEPYLVNQGNGEYLLFFTGLQGDNRKLGVGKGRSPLGPFEFNANPILVPGKPGAPDEALVLAPAALLDGNDLRLWYLASNRKELLSIGHATGNVSTVLQNSK